MRSSVPTAAHDAPSSAFNRLATKYSVSLHMRTFRGSVLRSSTLPHGIYVARSG